MSKTSCIFGALALECSAPPLRTSVSRATAAELADHIAADLARLLTGVEALDLVVAAATFDPSELLRPGWPIHAALTDLVRRAPDVGHSRVLGFGSHEDKMPGQLTPDPDLHEGPMRLMPFVLHGDPEAIAAVEAQAEDILLEKGMAQAALSFAVQKAFNVPLEHVRFMSLNDLVAITAMQYENANIAPLWPVINGVLFHPEQEVWLDVPPEPLLRWNGNVVRIAEMDFDTWREHGFVPAGFEGAGLERGFAFFQRRQEQYRAVLGCHAIAVEAVPVPAGHDPRAILAD